jgi:hypothetical protein
MKYLIYLLLFASVCFGQIEKKGTVSPKRDSFGKSGIRSSSFTYQPETIAHISRVESDSGVVYDPDGLDAFIVQSKADDSFISLKAIYDPNWGIKKSAQKVTKLYNVFGSDYNPDLVQADTGKQPVIKQFVTNSGVTTALYSGLFDGVNDYMNTTQTDDWMQPTEVIMSVKSVTWTSADCLIDGHDANHRMAIYQTSSIPKMAIYGGVNLNGNNNNLNIGTFGVISAKYNSANSYYQVNNLTAATGNAGTNDCYGFTLAAHFGGSNSSNIETGTVVIGYFTSIQESNIKNFLYSRWGIIISPVSLSLTALIQGFYNESTMVKDTVTVELHNAATPYALVTSSKGILDLNGHGTFNFPSAVNGTPYYVVIKHRNSIETWSATPQTFNAGLLN